MVNFEDINRLNPWWSEGGAILEDSKVKEVLSKTKKYKIEFFKEEGYYSVRGQRQVGKTTFLKLFIRHLIFDRKIDPKQIMFYSCDGLSNKNEIIETVNLYTEWTKNFGIKNVYIFLDEVTFIDRWYEAVKFLIDNNFVKGTFIFTGSMASDIKRGAERFPGRHVKNVFYYPMSFKEYAETFGGPNLAKALGEDIDIFNFKDVEKRANELFPFIQELNRLLEAYFITGRFFRSSYEYFEKGKVSEEIYEIYLNWILGDLSKLQKNEHIFKQVINSLCKKYGSPLSLNSIGKETDIGSHLTVGDYIETANDLLLVNTLPRLDINKKETIFRKDKKYYFSDPFLFSVFSSYVKGKYGNYVNEDNKSFIIEGMVLDYLRRVLTKDYLKPEEVWFYSDRRGEIDFIASDKYVPIEVKWQNNVSESDFKHADMFKNPVVLSKHQLSFGKIKIIPVSVFLVLHK